MQTSPDGFWSPDNSDGFALVTDLAAMANSAQAALAGPNARYDYAAATGSTSVASTGITTVNFPTSRFSVAPRVVATPYGNANVSVAHVTSITATNFQLRLYTIGGAQIAGTIHWHASQGKPTQADG